MKFNSLAILLILSSCALFAGEKLKFHSPDLKDPHFKLIFQFEIQQDSTIIEQISLNSKKLDNFIILKDGKKQSLLLQKDKYDFLIDYAWENDQKYKITLFYRPGGKEKIKKTEIKGVSPETGGIPRGEPGFYKTYIVEEKVGLKRKGELIYLTLTAPEKEFEEDSLLFLDGNTSIPYQIIERQESFPVEQAAKTHPVTNTLKIALPLHINPYEKKLLLVLKGKEESPTQVGFEITGEGFDKTVKNQNISLEFHSKSGQINTIEYLQEGIKLWNEVGVIHWNPGCYIPGIAWDHSFNWNPPPEFEESTGKLVYLNSRKGPLPNIRDIHLAVKYTLESNVPYFIVETQMQVKNDLSVIALRNDEMIFYNKLFDMLIYKDGNGKIIKMPLQEIKDAPNGLVHTTADNLDWVGLLNTEKEFGFFSLRIKYANINLNVAGDFLHKPATLFYAPADGKYVYWVRTLLYTWADYTTSNLHTFLPAESSFYEKNAFILLPLTNDFPEKLEILLKKLKNPLWVY